MAEVRPLPTAKTLFVCLMGDGDPPMAYSVIAIPVSSLFDDGSDVKFRPIKTWVGDELCYQSGCGFMKSNLYLIGGMKPLYKEPYYNPSFTRVYCLSQYGTAVLSVDLTSVTNDAYRSVVYRFEFCSEICSRFGIFRLKGDAIGEVFSNGSRGREFALCPCGGFPVRGLKEPAFESYNPGDKSWQKLDPPLFLDNGYECFAGETVVGYVVIGNKFCVSTNNSSFEYDVDAKEWRPCSLFDVVDSFGGPYDDWFHAHGGKPIPYGYPFGFQEEALIYDGDSLICIGQWSLVAHRIDGGKVVRTQPLTCLQIPLAPLIIGWLIWETVSSVTFTPSFAILRGNVTTTNYV